MTKPTSPNEGPTHALRSYLRKQIGQRKIKKFQFCDSKNDHLIQLADMVVGAIARR